MISILKSIWTVSPPGWQLLYLIGINFLILLTTMICHAAGLIPMWTIQVANFGFWMVYGVIFLFGQPRPRGFK
jgi:hypothetical protein